MILIQVTNFSIIPFDASPGGWWITNAPLISQALLVLTFLVAQIIGHYSRKAETRKTWYFKAYLEGSIVKVNQFFDNSEELVKEALENYINFPAGSEDRTLYVTSELEKISDLKRKFEVEVLSALKAAYPVAFKGIDAILLDFYDAASDSFNEDNGTRDPYFKFLASINGMKINLIKLLAQPAFGKVK